MRDIFNRVGLLAAALGLVLAVTTFLVGFVWALVAGVMWITINRPSGLAGLGLFFAIGIASLVIGIVTASLTDDGEDA